MKDEEKIRWNDGGFVERNRFDRELGSRMT